MILIVPLFTARGSLHSAEVSGAIPIGRSATLHSQHLDEDRTLWIATPPEYEDGAERYPVLYLLDAEFTFRFAAGIVDFLSKTKHIPPMIIVGIVNVDRSRDLTPEPGDSERERFPASGGADQFRRFMRDELVPWVDAKFRTRPFRILAGHSLGGLFAVHSYLVEETFTGFVASSPSLYWNDQSQVELARRVLSTPGNRTRVIFLSVGDEREEMIAGVEAVVSVLSSCGEKESEWRYDRMGDKDHEEMAFAGLYKGLEFVFNDYHDPNAIGERSFEDFLSNLHQKYGYEISLPIGFLFSVSPKMQARSCEDMAALLTYWSRHHQSFFTRFMDDWVDEGMNRIRRGEYECAESIFDLLVAVDEKGFGAQKGLGIARLRQGNRVGALEALQTADAIRPNDEETGSLIDLAARQQR